MCSNVFTHFGSHCIVLLLIYRFINGLFRSCHHKLPTVNELLKKKHAVCVCIPYISHRDKLQNHTYSCIRAGVQQEIGSVRCRWRLIGNWPMTQRHANNSSHVSLRAENVDGNSSSLSCCNEKGTRREIGDYSCMVCNDYYSHTFEHMDILSSSNLNCDYIQYCEMTFDQMRI